MKQFYYARRGVFLTEANDGEFGRQDAIENYERGIRNLEKIKEKMDYEECMSRLDAWDKMLREREEKK